MSGVKWSKILFRKVVKDSGKTVIHLNLPNPDDLTRELMQNRQISDLFRVCIEDDGQMSIRVPKSWKKEVVAFQSNKCFIRFFDERGREGAWMRCSRRDGVIHTRLKVLPRWQLVGKSCAWNDRGKLYVLDRKSGEMRPLIVKGYFKVYNPLADEYRVIDKIDAEWLEEVLKQRPHINSPLRQHWPS